MCEDTVVFGSEGWVSVNRAISWVIVTSGVFVIVLAIAIDLGRLVMLDFFTRGLCGRCRRWFCSGLCLPGGEDRVGV